MNEDNKASNMSITRPLHLLMITTHGPIRWASLSYYPFHLCKKQHFLEHVLLIIRHLNQYQHQKQNLNASEASVQKKKNPT